MHVKFNKISNNATGQCVCVTSGFCNRAGGSIYTQSTDGSGLIDMRIITVKVSYLIYLYKHNFLYLTNFRMAFLQEIPMQLAQQQRRVGLHLVKKL